MKWLKKMRAKRLQKELEEVCNNLLKTPNLPYKDQLAMIEATQEIFKKKLRKL